jgi:uncharacterized 2Fe-2S/4Fe-4S cluster protein (DUF4445 family)
LEANPSHWDLTYLIGLLPNARNKVVRIGNGALAARQMLLPHKKRKDAEKNIEKD